MGQALVVAAVALILVLALALVLQLWLYLPRTWRTARLGQIISYTLAALGGWLVSWLGLALGLALLAGRWGVRPRRWVLDAINIALIGSLIAILVAANVGMWTWHRAVRAAGRTARRTGID